VVEGKCYSIAVVEGKCYSVAVVEVVRRESAALTCHEGAGGAVEHVHIIGAGI
jgi:hypothetical protein